MNKNLRWKVVVILGVIALSVFAFYPPDQKVKLGLDLKGGVHLVLRVKTDDALRLETDTTVERLREGLTMAGVIVTRLEATGPTEFVVEGIQNDPGFRAGRRRGRYGLRSAVGRRRPLYLRDEAEHREPASRGGGHAGAADDRAARQRARRGRADRRAAGRP